MNGNEMSLLSRADRLLLRLGTQLVPREDREKWNAEWVAELYYMHHCISPSRKRTIGSGLLADALWLRNKKCRSVYSGSASLCLAALMGLLVLVSLPVVVFAGSLQEVLRYSITGVPILVGQSLLIYFVAVLTSANSTRSRAPLPLRPRIKSHVFSVAKTVTLLLSVFVLSEEISSPFHPCTRFVPFLTQNLIFVLLGLFALRWASMDGHQRCRCCLRVLSPSRHLGRVSHNFLEWNGTEIMCPVGHGRLSIPEMESSWCPSSSWHTDAA